MKRIVTITLVILMAVLMSCLTSAQVFADSLTEYISEVRIYTGNCDAAASEGFTILCEKDTNGNLKKDKNGNPIPVDLNQGAGGGWGSKGEKAVYLGYKTTTNYKEAITDLALMNMKGGYSVDDYDMMFDTYLKSQVIPFVERFMVAINEYRENYASENPANAQRAQYVYEILNRITDDDTGMGLGDLLLKPTKLEIGDEAYDALTDEQKKECGDIVTILAQSNGKTTIIIENLITRAADTNDNTWIDRFLGITYDDLVDHTGLVPTDARRELAKLYDDDAQMVLNMWENFREKLLDVDDSEALLDELEENQSSEEELEALDNKFEDALDNYSEGKLEDAMSDIYDEYEKNLEGMEKATNAIVRDYLETIDYEDGTLLDFFLRDSSEIEDDITVLYPLVCAFSDGQRAGLEFTSLKDLVLIAGTGEDGYSDETLDSFEGGSVYAGVDRAIYEKGGVALTSDALRTDALTKAQQEGENKLEFKWYNYAAFALTGIAAVGFLTSAGYTVYNGVQVLRVNRYITSTLTSGGVHYETHLKDLIEQVRIEKEGWGLYEYQLREEAVKQINFERTLNEGTAASYRANSLFGAKLAAGLTVAMVIIAGITTYLAWREMQAYYKVDFTPIPNYMVDEKDIMGYNSKGEKIFLKNQTAYYKAVECNRASDAEYYNVLGVKADMNGDVGKQWLALYSVKNEMMKPIIASSLLAVVGEASVPAGYSTGIHMFGSDAAFNLNSPLYDWNQEATKAFVYFNVDENVTANTGTNFTGGTIALTGGAGLAIGAISTALGMTVTGKKKKASA